ncbi:universal stress protein [Streptomyces sp. BK340]|uniref:universal stress protein n=1 Tax=Streptomyces sp. BK340 TaxID=2572903 RepID=UPI0011A2C6A4|nr:universal stress protein [Streptomyces sp. BK340]TVZ79395.1 nucleotide-binding universal stress UspA family protein [Streptomyces sp. BK340]
MTRPVTAGLDGSPESRAAAEWAAREAALRGLPLKIVHVWEPTPGLIGEAPLPAAETQPYWTERVPREFAEGIRLRHPGLDVTAEQRTGIPADVLCEAAQAAELLVLGSRGLGGLGGFLVGSVSLSVIARVVRPVVLVRAGEQAADEHRMDPAGVPSASAPFRPVVLGLDTQDPDETLLEFAFDAAARRDAPLRIVHGWTPPPVDPLSAVYDLRESIARSEADVLTEVVRPWLQKFPDVDVTEVSRTGHAAPVLVDASRDASLVVVGRRIRTSRLGAHIGHVTHAVLHHADAPVAVVAHG